MSRHGPRSSWLASPLLWAALAGGIGISGFVAPPIARAAESTGNIAGTVLTPGGDPVEFAEVTIASPEMMGIRFYETDTDGAFWFTALPPGLYEMEVSAEGYQTTLVQEIRVSIDRTATIEVALQEPTGGEEVYVYEERPTLDVEETSSGAVITKEFLEDVPASRSYQTAAQYAPGVTGGSNPNVRGGSSRENAWLLDGVNVSDPVTGTFSINLNFDAIEEVEVLTGGFAAEYGQAMGGIINVRTESGSNEFEAKLGARYSNGNLSPRRDATYDPYGRQIEATEFDRDSQFIAAYLNVGGPVVQDKVWFFGSYEYNRNISTASGVDAPRVFSGHLAYGKITIRPAPAHEIVVSALANPANINNRLQSRFRPSEANSRQSQGGILVQAQHRTFLGENFVLNNQLTYQKLYLDVTPQPCTWLASSRTHRCEGDEPEGYIDYHTPGIIGRAGANYRDNYTTYTFDDRYNISWNGSLSIRVPRFLGTHSFKIGGEVKFVRRNVVRGYPGNLYYFDRLEDADDPTSATNWYWVETNGQLAQNVNGWDFAAYLQDTWKPFDNLTINPGVRFDRSIYRNDVGEEIVNFALFSPRFGISWDPSRRGRTRLYFNAGQFADAGRLEISGFLDKSNNGFKLYLGDYFDQTQNYSYEQYLYARAQSDYQFHPQQTAPRNYQFNLGFDVLVWEQLKIGVEGTVKLFRYLWEDDEINLIWNDDGTQIIGSQSGIYDDFFRLRTPLLARRDYFAFTVSVNQNFHRNFQVQANYTYSVTRGTTPTHITAAFDNPTQADFEYGFLSSDRPHVIKIAGSYRFPYNINLGVRYTFSSGSRFDRQYFQDKTGGFANYRTVVGTFDSLKPTHNLNLLLTADVPIPRAGSLELGVEVSNVLNSRQVTGISQGALNGEGSYEATGRQRPTSFEFRLGYDF